MVKNNVSGNNISPQDIGTELLRGSRGGHVLRLR